MRWLLGPLWRRFALVLLLLGGLSLVPWMLAEELHDRLDGFAQEVDLAGSLRHRVATLGLLGRTDPPRPKAARERIDALVAEQDRVLTTLIEGDASAGVPPCPTVDTCEALRHHLRRWDGELVPLAREATGGSALAEQRLDGAVLAELGRVDRTVHRLARAVDTQVEEARRYGKYATLASAALVVLAVLGVWGVFFRIRRLRRALGTESFEELAREEARGRDELAALSGALGDAVAQLRRRSDEDRRRLARVRSDQRAVTAVASGLNQWLVGEETTGSWIETAARTAGFDAAWVHRIERDGRWVMQGASGIEPEVPAGLIPCIERRVRGGSPLELRGEAVPPVLAERGFRAVLCVPLGWGESHLGYLSMAARAQDVAGTDGKALLHVLGQILSLAVVARRLEREVRAAEQVAAMGGIARMLAHEVRNPLNSMRLHSRLLERRIGKLPEEHTDGLLKHVAVIDAELARLDTLVGDYVALGPGSPLRSEQVDLRELAEEVARVHDPVLSERGIELRLQREAGPYVAEVDRPRLTQVLHNLVRNAIEALDGVSGPRVELALESHDVSYKLIVRDNGPGLPDPDQVFSPSFTTKATGVGMGLPISRRIVELHDGRLEARSRPGGGAEFVLHLPRAGRTYRPRAAPPS